MNQHFSRVNRLFTVPPVSPLLTSNLHQVKQVKTFITNRHSLIAKSRHNSTTLPVHQILPIRTSALFYLIAVLSVLCFTVPSLFVTAEPVCSIQQFQCGPSLECIPLSQKCDGYPDCPDKSDEIDCFKKNCTDDEFSCPAGKCIPKDWLCDGQNDCSDNSDEANCEITCPQYQFKCFDSKKCIDKSNVCDGKPDCFDSSDEGTIACLFHVSYCAKGEFNCTNGHCIDASLTCNDKNDCGDNSDETLPSCKSCFSNEFKCNSGKCISLDLVCNHVKDCAEGEDETECDFEPKRCEDYEFACHNRMECVNKHWVCDKNADCADESDELNCTFACKVDEFMCSNHHCIPESMRCDGTPECSDGSDEANCNGPDLLGNFTSGEEYGISNDNHSSPFHVCQEGYHLEPEHYTCEDIDECIDDYSICSGQTCINNPGSFNCSCLSGYHLFENRHCLLNRSTPNLMIYGIQNQMQLLKWTHRFGEYPSVHNEVEHLFQSGNSSVIFSHNVHSNYYVASNQRGQFYIDRLLKDRPLLDIHSTPNVFVEQNRNESAVVKRMSIDWINHLLYFINMGHNRIEALKITKLSNSLVIIDSGLDSPQDIKVNPIESWIVWTDAGSAYRPARIERSSQDGFSRKILFQDENDILLPTQLTIDFATKRIFWVDAKLHSISSIDYHGNDRRLIFQSFHAMQVPLDLDVLDSNLYWSDANTSSIYTINKFGLLDDHDSIVHRLIHHKSAITSMAIVDISKQPSKETNNSLCASCPYLCSPSAPHDNLHCSCPKHYIYFNGNCLTWSEYELKTKIQSDDSNWWFSPKMLKFESDKWYLIAVVVIILLVVAFLAPYLLRLLCNIGANRKNYRWIKLNNLKQSRAATKSVELGGTLLATVSANRRDDVSSGYSSISEQLSRQEVLTEEADDENDNDSDGSNETQVYKPCV